jgi:hypothetical protein
MVYLRLNNLIVILHWTIPASSMGVRSSLRLALFKGELFAAGSLRHGIPVANAAQRSGHLSTQRGVPLLGLRKISNKNPAFKRGVLKPSTQYQVDARSQDALS